MDSLIGSKVKVIKKDSGIEFEGDLKIVDKIMTCKSTYYNSAIMNNASFEAYVGQNLHDNSDTLIVLFKPTDIKKIY